MNAWTCRTCPRIPAPPRVFCDACLAWISDLARRVASVSTRFEVVAPVEDADVATIHNTLAAASPRGLVPRVTVGERALELEVFAPSGARRWRTYIPIRGVS